MDLLKLPERPLRLAFFGTPEIARVVLERLIAAQTDLVLLAICQPDRPRGRGKKVEPPPVKEAALLHGIEVLQPLKLKDGAVAAKLRELALDLAIVVAYGRILPPDVFEAPAHGTWNVHASLLPRHRGASPIQHAILAGDPETGVTLMQMTAGLDEGAMLLKRAIALGGDETGGSLTAKLAELGASALLEGLALAKTTGLPIEPQDPALATHAPLLEKAEGAIDFDLPAAVIARRVRALTPWPGTFVPGADGQPIKITRARELPAAADQPPGTIVEAGDRLTIATGFGLLEILELQPPGKRNLRAADYLRGAGRHLQIGTRFADR
jgi:methionyl-tRNA formyltransferase